MTPGIQNRPAAAKKAPAKAADAPERGVDVVNFRLLPLSGAPSVSPAEDKTLGTMDPIALFMAKLERKNALGALVAKSFRFVTTVVGPVMYGVSAVLNWRRLLKAIKDPTLKASSKIALGVGTVFSTLGAIGAGIAALPLKIFGRFGLTSQRKIAANKASSIAGGIGNIAFSAINLVETLRNKSSKPAERFFAKLNFGVGIGGFLIGTVALLTSMPWMASIAGRMPWLLPLATKLATAFGIGGFVAWIGQTLLGKNKWLNEHLEGSVLA